MCVHMFVCVGDRVINISVEIAAITFLLVAVAKNAVSTTSLSVFLVRFPPHHRFDIIV